MKALLAFSCAVAIAASGCRTPQMAPGLEERVQLLAGVPPYIVVDSCSLRRDTGVPMFVGDLRNSSRVANSNLEWQVEFQDELGTQVAKSDTRWIKITLAPGESKQIQLLASNPTARQFRLQLRPR